MQSISAEPLADTALVVIPTLNEKKHIAATITNVLSDPAAANFLIVVSDGGSTDGTAEIVSGFVRDNPNVLLIANSRRIQSAGINLAARLHGGDRRWMVRMDAHARYPQSYVSQLLEEIAESGASSVVVSMRAAGEKFFQKAVAVAQNSLLGTGGSSHRRDGEARFVDHGHHAVFDMSQFRALAGYDEEQTHNEDAEFDCRLLAAGGTIWLTRKCSIDYFPRSRAHDLFRQYYSYGRGRATTMLRHRSFPKLRQLLPAAVVPALAASVFAPWTIFAALPALLWVLSALGYGCALGIRQRRLCAFASGWAALIMHLGWSLGFWSGLKPALSPARQQSRVALGAPP